MRRNFPKPLSFLLLLLLGLSPMLSSGCSMQGRRDTGGWPFNRDRHQSATVPLSSDFILNDQAWRGDVASAPALLEERPWDPPAMLVGAGARHNIWTPEGKKVWWREAVRMGAPVNSHAIWANREFEEYWFGREEFREMAKGGVTPVLVLYYFGDDISVEFVSDHYTRYREWLQRVLRHVSGPQEVLVVLEPEFNNLAPPGQHHAKDWEPFATLMVRAAAEVRHFLPNAIVGLCPGDYRSNGLDSILTEVSPHLDFLAYQELWGSTRMHNLGEEEEDVTEYALRFTKYLASFSQERVLLAYLGISTYGAEGEADDWNLVQAKVIRNMEARLEEFIEAGLFGVLIFALYDNPDHVGYFGPAEAHWGVLTVEGLPKPGMEAFADLARAVEKVNGGKAP